MPTISNSRYRRAAEGALAALPARQGGFPRLFSRRDQRRARLRLDRDVRPRRARLSLLLPRAVRPPMHNLPPPRRLRRHVRPDDRRPRPARRHRALHRDREGFHHLRRGGEVRRRQGDPRRHGPGADDARARRGRHRHHQRRHPRPLGDRQGRRRHQGRAHRRDRQGRQPGHPAGRRPSSSAPAPR